MGFLAAILKSAINRTERNRGRRAHYGATFQNVFCQTEILVVRIIGNLHKPPFFALITIHQLILTIAYTIAENTSYQG